MSKFKAFFGSLVSLAKAHPVLFFLFLFIVVVFISAPFFFVWGKLKPLVAKASPALATKLDDAAGAV